MLSLEAFDGVDAGQQFRGTPVGVNMQYVELHARSAFSFLRGASLPEQLSEDAATLGLSAMALCDRDGVYGAPRFFGKSRETGLRPIIGVELTMEDGKKMRVEFYRGSGYLSQSTRGIPLPQRVSSLKVFDEAGNSRNIDLGGI